MLSSSLLFEISKRHCWVLLFAVCLTAFAILSLTGMLGHPNKIAFVRAGAVLVFWKEELMGFTDIFAETTVSRFEVSWIIVLDKLENGRVPQQVIQWRNFLISADVVNFQLSFASMSSTFRDESFVSVMHLCANSDRIWFFRFLKKNDDVLEWICLVVFFGPIRELSCNACLKKLIRQYWWQWWWTNFGKSSDASSLHLAESHKSPPSS